jgi:ATP/maltotriose-dependent transcriptional regulator MalT
LARVERARNDPDAAWEAIRAAEQIANEQPLGASQSRWVKFAAARWWLTERDFDRANHLLQESGVASDSITRDGITLDGTLPRLQEPEAMLLLRLSLAQGDYEAALRLTGHLLSPAKAARRTGRVIEILVLQALALQGKRETAQAMSVLSEALSLAQPGGFVRVFLDEGEPIARLLYQVRSQNAGRGYASELLTALGGMGRADLPADQHLIERLTSREIEVLKLIRTGDTNQDIADRLVISIPTVKRHISNINDKLGAKNRTQAVSLAKELGLLD